MALLEVNHLNISFGGLHAVDDFHVSIEKGQLYGLIGPNGAGKTTIFNLLTGVYKPDEGIINLDGQDITGKSTIDINKAGIARTFQNIRLFSDMRVIENVLVGAHIKTKYDLASSIFRTKKFREEEDVITYDALKVLKEVGLYDRKDDYASNLPYGDQRKLEIARAIATGARLILLDEPAAGMNPQESHELMEFIRLLKKQGYTVLMIEHDMSVVMNISDRIYVIDHGKPIAEGLPEEIAKNQKVIDVYLGGSNNAAKN